MRTSVALAVDVGVATWVGSAEAPLHMAPTVEGEFGIGAVAVDLQRARLRDSSAGRARLIATLPLLQTCKRRTPSPWPASTHYRKILITRVLLSVAFSHTKYHQVANKYLR